MNFDDIHHVAMIGAGTMGAGMSWCFAQAGYTVSLYDVSLAQLAKAGERIGHIREMFVQEGLSSAGDAEAAVARIGFCTELDAALTGAQYVLEAVPERLDLKQRLFTQFEALCPTDAILASNTSGLRITDIAAVCRHPEPRRRDALGQPARAGAAGRGHPRGADLRRDG